MKKKKNKERRAEKKAMKQAEKQKKYCSTALEWSDIEMIDGDAIHIRDGSTRERIIGLKVTPQEHLHRYELCTGPYREQPAHHLQ